MLCPILKMWRLIFMGSWLVGLLPSNSASQWDEGGSIKYHPETILLVCRVNAAIITAAKSPVMIVMNVIFNDFNWNFAAIILPFILTQIGSVVAVVSPNFNPNCCQISVCDNYTELTLNHISSPSVLYSSRKWRRLPPPREDPQNTTFS